MASALPIEPAAPSRAARPAGASFGIQLDLVLLVILAVPAAAIDWQIAATWSWPVAFRLAWLGLTAVALPLAIVSPRLRSLAIFAVIASLYAVPVDGGILRWHFQSSGTAVIGDGAMQTQLAGSFLLQGIDPYGADYGAAGLATAPWNEPFASPALHHLVTWPGQFLLPLPLQALSTWALHWWDERIFLLLSALAIGILLVRLRPGSAGRVAAIAFFLLPLHSLIAVLGDNDLPAVALILGALLAADRKRFLWMGTLLGLAIATKQHAALAIPIVATWAVVRGASPGILGRAAGAAGAIIVAIILPFVAWNPQAFFDDTIVFLIGSGTQAYPINGMGLSTFLLNAGVLHGARDAFPFAVLEVVAALVVWVGAAAWLCRRGVVADALTWCGIAFLFVLFVSRYFHDTHLLLGAELIAAGLGARWALRNSPLPDPDPQAGEGNLTRRLA